MRMQFGLSSFVRAEGDLPELPVINMYAEAAPVEETGVVLQSRKGLDDRSANMGAGPVDCLFQRDGVLSGVLFGVSANTLYQATTSRGAVTGAGPWSIAGFELALFAAGGSTMYYWNGTTLAAVAFPDSANVSKVIAGASRVIAIRADTQKFYWSDALDVDIDALDFATAESQPDRVRDLLFIDDTLIVFGAETVEFWPNTGDATLPFQPLEGRVFEKGIRATGCATALGTSFAWVTDQNEVCLGDADNVISTPGLEEEIIASAACRLWTFRIAAQEFLALRIDSGTFVYGAKNKLWSEMQTYGLANWQAQCFAMGVFGSATDGKTLAFGSDYTDNGTVLERRFRGGFPLNSSGLTVNNITVRTNPGNTPYLTGEYSDPRIEMRLSRDAGKTWGAWKVRTTGTQGEYRQKVRWAALGMASQPGLLAEWRVTDPVPARISDVLINEPLGGR